MHLSFCPSIQPFNKHLLIACNVLGIGGGTFKSKKDKVLLSLILKEYMLNFHANNY